MTDEELIQRIQSMDWERWLDRPFDAFVVSAFEDSSRRENFDKIGVPDVELDAQLCQNHIWYFSPSSFQKMDEMIEVYLVNHDMFEITSNLERFKNESGAKINELLKSEIAVAEKFAEVFEIMTLSCTYIWLAHGIESYYKNILRVEVPKYIEGDIDKFVGDASFPKKRNGHDQLEDAIRSGVPDEEVSKRWGWVKIRDGFSAPFTPEEIATIRREIQPKKTAQEVEIPNQLVDLMDQLQELVFFRTERTDVFFYLLYLARPILKDLADKYGIPFDEMRFYRAKSFLTGKPEKYFPTYAFAYLDREIIFQSEPIFVETDFVANDMISGNIAYGGKVSGTVKIVERVSDLDKVHEGDIMVAHMTFPSYISAMQRAAGFVTDEGGITCHAAIVARELKKPCIIGTKNATKILKDGDIVEVDAETGIVKIIAK